PHRSKFEVELKSLDKLEAFRSRPSKSCVSRLRSSEELDSTAVLGVTDELRRGLTAQPVAPIPSLSTIEDSSCLHTRGGMLQAWPNGISDNAYLPTWVSLSSGPSTST